MVYRKKVNKTKEKIPFSKAQVKAVARIARKVDLKENEHKSFFSSVASTTMFDQVIYARALNYLMGQGTGSEQYIGEKIFLKNIHIKGHISFVGNTLVAPTCRLLIIRSTNKVLTNSASSITYSDVFRSGSNNSGIPTSCLHIDLHKVDVLYDSGSKTFKKDTATSVPKYPFDIKAVIQKNKTITADNSGYFKGGDYYFLYMAEDSTANNMANISYDWTVNFADA